MNRRARRNVVSVLLYVSELPTIHSEWAVAPLKLIGET